MTINRESMLDKIRALMAKTTQNGCTEAEALAALAKARAMMDAYEVTEADLKLSREEAAILRKEPPGSRDPHKIKNYLGMAVAKFCDCEVWRGADGLVFCGLPSDARFATWLMDHLAAYVQHELAAHLIGCIAPKGDRRLVIKSFVIGCTTRIAKRINELCQQSKQQATSNGHALVVIKNQAVAAKMAELNLNLRAGRSSRPTIDPSAYAAGQSAGNRATFARPVGGNGSAALIGKS